MPNLQNAVKALRQSEKRASRNKVRLSEIDNLTRQFRKLLEAGKNDEAKALVSKIYKSLDKAVGKKIVKANAAARTKSRITLRLNKVVAK